MSEEIKKLKQEIYKRDIQIRELKKLATKDPLTGLYNRRGFEEEVSRIIKDISYGRENQDARRHFFVDSISILFFDVDNFKKLNDVHGHKIGDQMLQRVAQIISGKVRSVDFVARWGGEEFVAALLGANLKAAKKVAEKLRKGVEKKKIVIAVREIVDKKILRASPHFFNSEEEIQKVVDEIRKL